MTTVILSSIYEMKEGSKAFSELSKDEQEDII